MSDMDSLQSQPGMVDTVQQAGSRPVLAVGAVSTGFLYVPAGFPAGQQEALSAASMYL